MPLPAEIPPHTDEYFQARGELLQKEGRTLVILPSRCPQLAVDGLCTIYDWRPHFCRVYKPGDPACLAAVKRQRTPEDFQRIREDSDPEGLWR